MEFDAAHKTWCGVQVIFKINGHLFKFTYHKKPYNSYTVVTFGTVNKTFKCKAASYTCVLEVNSLKFLLARDVQLFWKEAHPMEINF